MLLEIANLAGILARKTEIRPPKNKKPRSIPFNQVTDEKWRNITDQLDVLRGFPKLKIRAKRD
jgi:hypothetical protein